MFHVFFSLGDQPGIGLHRMRTDPKEYCLCCRGQSETFGGQKPSRVIYWEIPKSKFEGCSVTAADYKEHELSKRYVKHYSGSFL